MNNANQPTTVSDHNARRIIVAAASARGLAASSLCAGRPVSTIDLFADADTAAMCEKSNRHLLPNQSRNFTWQCEDMDEIFERVEQLLSDQDYLDQSGPAMILVGGGFENCFRNHVSSNNLMGQSNVAAFLETARISHVAEFCRRNSIQFPSVNRELDFHLAEQQWLIKAEYSSGGLGVQFAQKNTSLQSDQYFQKYIAGQSISACYVAAAGADSEESSVVELLGVCEPVLSSSAFRSSGPASDQPFPFRYAGSIGPINLSRLSETTLSEFKRVGSLAANHFGIVGIFGVDFVLEQDSLWLLEINPRVTASAELIEYAARQAIPNFSIVQLHLDALSGEAGRTSALLETCQKANSQNRLFAKQIVYRDHKATQTLRVTQSLLGALASQFGGFAGGLKLPRVSGLAFITDVPRPKTVIEAGHPILTLHVAGESHFETEQALARALEVLETMLGERLS